MRYEDSETAGVVTPEVSLYSSFIIPQMLRPSTVGEMATHNKAAGRRDLKVTLRFTPEAFKEIYGGGGFATPPDQPRKYGWHAGGVQEAGIQSRKRSS